MRLFKQFERLLKHKQMDGLYTFSYQESLRPENKIAPFKAHRAGMINFELTLYMKFLYEQDKSLDMMNVVEKLRMELAKDVEEIAVDP